MDQFLQGCKLVCLYFLECKEPLGPPSGQLNGLYLLPRQSVHFLVLLDLPALFFLCGVVIGVNDKVVLPQYPGLLHVVVEDGLQVEV